MSWAVFLLKRIKILQLYEKYNHINNLFETLFSVYTHENYNDKQIFNPIAVAIDIQK